MARTMWGVKRVNPGAPGLVAGARPQGKPVRIQGAAATPPFGAIAWMGNLYAPRMKLNPSKPQSRRSLAPAGSIAFTSKRTAPGLP